MNIDIECKGIIRKKSIIFRDVMFVAFMSLCQDVNVTIQWPYAIMFIQLCYYSVNYVLRVLGAGKYL